MHLELEVVLPKPQRNILTGSSAQCNPKAKVSIEVLPPVKGGRWKALNFLGAGENHLLPELRKTQEKQELAGLPIPPFRFFNPCLHVRFNVSDE